MGQRLLLLLAIVVCAMPLGAVPAGPIETLGTVLDYVDLFEFYSDLPGLFSSHEKCLARGYGNDLCDAVLGYCATYDKLGTGISGAFISAFQLNELFKVDCGNGVCFACCHVPGSGCHTSFFDDKGPPINCNENYGAGAAVVGAALVLDPKPGQACLFTGQICEHLPICVSHRSAAAIDALNRDPNHPMKSPRAVQSRARNFGTSMMAKWANFLDAYHTTSDRPTNTLRREVYPLHSIGDLITGRGCTGWRGLLPPTFPADWSEPQFRIDTSDGKYAEEPSHLNGVRQLGVVKVMSSIPNLYERLAYVESRIWTPATIRQYLAPIGDADSVLLRTMSPLALQLLKNNATLQDYRLLAVPLAGETPAPRQYNGCTLAGPPSVTVRPIGRTSGGAAVDVTTNGAAMLVLWGDGSATRVTGNQTVSHDYRTAGRYQVLTVSQNDSGLRAVGAAVVDASASASASPAPLISEVQLVDLRATFETLTGNEPKMLFELEAWPSQTAGFSLGTSRPQRIVFNLPVRFGTIGGWNMRAAPLQSITIRPSRYGDGVIIGFRRSYFTVSHIRLGVYSTSANRLRFVDVPVTADMVRLYTAGATSPVNLTQPLYGADGRLQIPVETATARYTRIDLVLPQSAFASAIQQPVTDPNWRGITGTYAETIPDDVNAPAPKRRSVRAP